MPIMNQTQKLWVLFGLIVLMFATRFHHFGSVSFLPDASLAVFFLAGFYALQKHEQQQKTLARLASKHGLVFTVLIILAGLIDYIAINNGGVSDWCVTPAYLFLIPTYAIMYLAGRRCGSFNLLTLSAVGKITTLLLAAVAVAFLLSNGSFYLFSGRYAEMDALFYAERVVQYFLPYAAYTLLYTGLALSIHVASVKTLQTTTAKQLG